MSSRTPTTSRGSAMRLHTYAAAIWQTMFTMYCAASLRDIGISQRANPVQNGSTSIVAGDAASLRDIVISQCANPVQNGNTSIVAGDAAGRACKSVAQQEEPAKAWRSRKSLHKHGTAQDPRQAWRAKITLSIIGGLGNNISGETTTNHNQLEKIDTADEPETVSQYKAYDAIHLSENADEQKPDNEPTRNIGAV